MLKFIGAFMLTSVESDFHSLSPPVSGQIILVRIKLINLRNLHSLQVENLKFFLKTFKSSVIKHSFHRGFYFTPAADTTAQRHEFICNNSLTIITHREVGQQLRGSRTRQTQN